MTDLIHEAAARTLAKIVFATEIAEKAGTSVVIPGTDMRAVLEYVEQLVLFYNKNNTSKEQKDHESVSLLQELTALDPNDPTIALFLEAQYYNDGYEWHCSFCDAHQPHMHLRPFIAKHAPKCLIARIDAVIDAGDV